jgi:subtilisin family serine protease
LAAGAIVASPPGVSADERTDEIERRVIVELDGTPALLEAGGVGAFRMQRSALEDRQAQLADLADERGIDLTVEHSYSLTFDGFAATVADEDVTALAALPGVVAVHDDQEVSVSTVDSVPLIGAPEVWEQTDPDGLPVRGEGITVAIIDTGIDYMHPDLGGGFGPDHKVVAGYDFVNEDDDPMDDHYHGTHVAGIVAGDGEGPEGVTGVAPAAQLTAYKVLDRFGAGATSWVIAGIEAAADPDSPYTADVINLSLGGPGDGTDAMGRAASVAAESGIVVVAAAGNAGPGIETITSPANADGVLSVGASVSGVRVPTARLEEPRREQLSTYRVVLSANPPDEPLTAEVVDIGLGRPEDYDGVDVAGKVVIYQGGVPANTGQISVADIVKAREAEERGAVAVLGYEPFSGPFLNHDERQARVEARVRESESELSAFPGPMDSGDDLRMDELVMLGMDESLYAELAVLLQDGAVQVTIDGTDATDQIASFSSRGPTTRYSLKPEIVAPGMEIRSTALHSNTPHDRIRASGTSMAAPHVAGAVALLRQLHPTHDAEQITSVLIGSAKEVDHSGPITVGAGRLDVAAAADAIISASPATLSLGLADLSADTVGTSATVTLNNSGDDDITADLDAVTAPGSIGSATVSPASVTIAGGESVEVTVKVSGQRPEDEAQLSGWMVASSEEAPDLRIPFDLSVRPLIVRMTPDPSDGTTEAFVYSPVVLDDLPVVEMTPPTGRPVEVTARPAGGTWYRADLASTDVGVHHVSARAQTPQGPRLVGDATFEVTPEDQRPGRSRWEPVGPNSHAGYLATSQDSPGQAAMTTAAEAGVWLTEDYGQTWAQVRRLPVAGGNGEVIIDPSDGDQMWYVTNGGSWDPTYQGKILRSRDRGQTWITLDIPDVPISALVTDPGGQVLAAVTPTAVLLSHDGGDSWTSYPASWPSIPRGAAISGGDLYISTGNAILVMRDVVENPSPLKVVYESESLLAGGVAADEEIVVTSTINGSVVGSRDGGVSWEELHNVGFGSIASLRVSEGDIALNGVRRSHLSRDYGRTWQEIPKAASGSTADFNRWPGGTSTRLFSLDRSGLFATDDLGESYKRIGVQGLTVYDLALAEDEDGKPALLAGTDSGTYRTPQSRLPSGPVRLRPDAAEWGLSAFEGGGGTTDHLIVTAPSDPTVVWQVRETAIGTFHINRSDDAGQTWDTRGSAYEVAHALFVHPDDPDYVMVSYFTLRGQGVIVTADGGETWRQHNHGMFFEAIVADPANPDRLWLGGYAGLFRSDDEGRTVTKVLDGTVSAIEVDRRVPDRMVIGGEEIRVSTDGGASFEVAETGDLEMRVSDIVTSTRSSNIVYAGTTSYVGNGLLQGGRGVLRSQDGGKTWVSISGGLQNLDVTSLEVSSDRRWLYAGTVSGGVHRLRLF